MAAALLAQRDASTARRGVASGLRAGGVAPAAAAAPPPHRITSPTVLLAHAQPSGRESRPEHRGGPLAAPPPPPPPPPPATPPRADTASRRLSQAHACALLVWGLHPAEATQRTGASLHALLRTMFDSAGVLARFRVDAASFAAFTSGVEASMGGPTRPATAFHTFAHCWSVTHATWLALSDGGQGGGLLSAGALTQLDAFALLCAALWCVAERRRAVACWARVHRRRRRLSLFRLLNPVSVTIWSTPGTRTPSRLRPTRRCR